jgi:hypothetical protein
MLYLLIRHRQVQQLEDMLQVMEEPRSLPGVFAGQHSKPTPQQAAIKQPIAQVQAVLLAT